MVLVALLAAIAGFVAPRASAEVTSIGNLGDTLRVEFKGIVADVAPPGATVNGAVYWQVYRALVTNVVLINPATGQHLAQWNIWQPGAPLP